MSYNFSTRAGQAKTETIPLPVSVAGYTLTVELSNNSDFQVILNSKSVTGSTKSVYLPLSATEVDALKSGYFRIKGVKAGVTEYLQSGRVSYTVASTTATTTSTATQILATDYGVVADGSTDQTTNFATWIAAVKAASAYGAVGVLPPSNQSYVGKIVLDGNYGALISAYGAKLSVPDGQIGVTVQGANGGSALGWKLEGLLVRGLTTNTTGVKIIDCDRTMLRDIRVENVTTGFLLNASSTSAWVESTTIRDCVVNGCQVGVDFVVTGGGRTSFDQTNVDSLAVNNATVAGVRLGTDLDIVRMKLDVTCWVGTGGCVLDSDADMTGVFGRIMGERYSGATGVTAGIRPRSNSSGWDECNIETRLNGSLNPLIDTTVMTTGQWVALREGNQFLSQSAASVTSNLPAWQIRTFSQTFPVVAAYRSTPSLIPGGNPGLVFGTGAATPDTYINRPTGSTYARLESNAVLTIGAYTTGTRPAASTGRSGAFYWDTGLKRMAYSDTVNWVGGNGNTIKTANYSITSGDKNCVVIYNGTSLIATLPTAVGFGTDRVTIKNINVSALTLATAASQTIDGAAPGTLAQFAFVNLMSDGANWVKV